MVIKNIEQIRERRPKVKGRNCIAIVKVTSVRYTSGVLYGSGGTTLAVVECWNCHYRQEVKLNSFAKTPIACNHCKRVLHYIKRDYHPTNVKVITKEEYNPDHYGVGKVFKEEITKTIRLPDITTPPTNGSVQVEQSDQLPEYLNTDQATQIRTLSARLDLISSHVDAVNEGVTSVFGLLSARDQLIEAQMNLIAELENRINTFEATLTAIKSCFTDVVPSALKVQVTKK